jgi:aminoglycoside 2''-phosphotransferase
VQYAPIDEHVCLGKRVTEEVTTAEAQTIPEAERGDVLVINDTLVFRFPRTSAEIATLASEASILRAIRGRLPLPTPDPGYENLETRAVGTAFIGYTRLPGEPL